MLEEDQRRDDAQDTEDARRPFGLETVGGNGVDTPYWLLIELVGECSSSHRAPSVHALVREQRPHPESPGGSRKVFICVSAGSANAPKPLKRFAKKNGGPGRDPHLFFSGDAALRPRRS